MSLCSEDTPNMFSPVHSNQRIAREPATAMRMILDPQGTAPGRPFGFPGVFRFCLKSLIHSARNAEPSMIPNIVIIGLSKAVPHIKWIIV